MFHRKHETQVLVVGAGPVGLFTALCLAERGVAVTIVDKDWRSSSHSFALALHPGSLELLDELGVARPLLEHGQRVQRVAVYEGAERVGDLNYSTLAGAFRFALVVPQSRLEQALAAALEAHGVKVLWHHEAREIEEHPDGATVQLDRLEKQSAGYAVAVTEWMVAKTFPMKASIVVGADGFDSRVRNRLALDFEELGPAERFAVFEFQAAMDFDNEVRLVFHDGLANVLWPLGPGGGRFSFQVDEVPVEAERLETLQRLIGERAPWFRPTIDAITWAATPLFERRLASRFGRDHVWLAGDAAHVTGPIGVQSMNAGLREARDLAARLSAVLEGAAGPDLLEAYDRERRREWQLLLGGAGVAETAAGAPQWARDLAARLPACVPASGGDLEHLLGQVGLNLQRACA